MAFQHCPACPDPAGCAAAVAPDGFNLPIPHNGPDKPGMCWNAYTNVTAQRPAAVGIGDPALAQHPIAQANAASWPTGKPAPRPPKPAGEVAQRPAAGTTTGRVWEIADAAAAEPGWDRDGKAFRKTVIARCATAGINLSTASVQFSKWLSSRS